MTRLRYTLDEARAAATGIAKRVIQCVDANQTARLISIRPDRMATQGLSSKHPTRGLAMFVWHDPNVTLDGGETFVAIDLESQTGEIVE